MKPEQYTSIRVEKVDRANLEYYRRGLATQVARNPDRFPYYLREGVISLSCCVRYLLEQQRRHTARAGAAKLAKAKRGG